MKTTTDKKTANQTAKKIALLNESQKLAETILNNLPDMVIIHQNGKILYVNPALTKVTGYEQEEMANTNIMDYILEEYKQQIIDSIKKRLAGGSVNDYEAGFKMKKGGSMIATVRGNPIIFRNEPAILAVLIDVTKRKEDEQKLKEFARELEEKVEELERFKRLTVGRELKMIEMKKEIDALKKQLKETAKQ